MAEPIDEQRGHWVYLKDLVEMRALRPKFARTDEGKERRGGVHQDHIERASAAIDRINMVWLQFLRRGEVDAPLRKLILIDSIYQRPRWVSNLYRRTFLPPSLHPVPPDALHIRMGPWLDPFFEKPELVPLHHDILEFRLRQRFWEERLLTYIDMHASLQHRRVLRCQIRSLFEELSLPRDLRRPWDTRNHFEGALARLKENHHIHDWQPSGECSPASKDWFEQWQEQFINIIVRPPVNG